VQKIKDARSEAAKEIEAYKAKKEAEYKKYENDVSVASGRCLSRDCTVVPMWSWMRRHQGM